MAEEPRRRTVQLPGVSYSITLIGERRSGFHDVYHWLLRLPWWAAIGVIVGAYLSLNAIFALGYLALGGIANAAPGSFLDAFFFSVQTMGTIGYGAMFPATRAANGLVVLESVTGLVVTALATGLVFVRFSLTRARMVFAEKAAIGPMDGVPTLMVRLGNDRNNQIVDAQIRLMLSMSVITAEGVKFYRTADLPLMRDRATALSRSWTALHRIDDSSPLKGQTPESFRASECEISIAVSGVDETSMQTVHARFTYEHPAIAWGARLADVLSETADGNMVLDLRRFHEIAATEPLPHFPYPKR